MQMSDLLKNGKEVQLCAGCLAVTALRREIIYVPRDGTTAPEFGLIESLVKRCDKFVQTRVS